MTGVTDERSLVTTTSQPSRWRRRITAAVVVAACLLIVAALAVLGWRWRHPTFFPPGTARVSDGVTTHPNVTNWIGLTYPDVSRPQAILHIDGVQPRIAYNSADARISFFVCTNIQPPGPAELALGSVQGDVSKYCSDLVPATDVDMPTGRGHFENLVMRVVATQPGKVRVNGIDVRYKSGWQHGTQWTGNGVIITAR
jgi:hypothetical protein